MTINQKKQRPPKKGIQTKGIQAKKHERTKAKTKESKNKHINNIPLFFAKCNKQFKLLNLYIYVYFFETFQW